MAIHATGPRAPDRPQPGADDPGGDEHVRGGPGPRGGDRPRARRRRPYPGGARAGRRARGERQRRLEAAIDGGERSRAALVAEVWDDVPEQLRGAAAVAMQAHLETLEDEGRLPPDIKD